MVAQIGGQSFSQTGEDSARQPLSHIGWRSRRHANQPNGLMKRIAAFRLLICSLLVLTGAAAVSAAPRSGTIVIETALPYAAAWPRLQAAIQKHRLGVVSRASASAGAKSRGVSIPGNMVVGVFRNDFAVRMLAASVEAGIEAPLRFYLTEAADGHATLSYRKPSAVFAAYGTAGLQALAHELDAIFSAIAADASR